MTSEFFLNVVVPVVVIVWALYAIVSRITSMIESVESRVGMIEAFLAQATVARMDADELEKLIERKKGERNENE